MGPSDRTRIGGVRHRNLTSRRATLGLVRDLVGDPAAPIVFSAALMVATVLGLAVFRRIELGSVGA